MNVKQPIQPSPAAQLIAGNAQVANGKKSSSGLEALLGKDAGANDSQFGAVLDQEMIQAMQLAQAQDGLNPELANLKAEQLMALQNTNPEELAKVQNTNNANPELQALLVAGLDPKVILADDQVLQAELAQMQLGENSDGLVAQKNLDKLNSPDKVSIQANKNLPSQAPALELLSNESAEVVQPVSTKMAAAIAATQAQSAYGMKKASQANAQQAAVVGAPIMMNDVLLKQDGINPKIKSEGFKNYSQFTEKKLINPKNNAAIVDKEAAMTKIMEASPTQMENAIQNIAPVDTSLKPETQLKGSETPKVLNLNQVDFSQGADKVIDQISNYIIQAKTSKMPSLDVKVQHDDLGLINIHVEKMKKGEMLNLVIQTHSPEANMVLKAHQQDLLANLSSAGVSIGEFKLETSSSNSTNSNKEFSQNNGNQENARSKEHFGSEQNQRKHDQDRRQNLWDILKDKEAA
jgi:hypothetical protein